MKHRWRALCVAGAFLLGAGSVFAAAQRSDGILRERRDKDPHAADKDKAEGQAAPELSLKDWLNTDTGSVQLKNFEGQVVLVCFLSSSSQTCRRTLPQVVELARTRKAAGLTVLGVCAEQAAGDLKQLVDDFSITFPVAWDRHGEAKKAWMVDGTPDYWIIARDGTVRVADLADSALGSALGRVMAEGAPPPPDPLSSLPTTPAETRARSLSKFWPEATFGVFANGVRLGNLILRNSWQEGGPEGAPKGELAFEDELNILFHSIELTTHFKGSFRFTNSGSGLSKADISYIGLPSSDATARFVSAERESSLIVRGQELQPRFPLFSDIFLARIPALCAPDFDPQATYSWINFVDGRLYDGVSLGPTGQVSLRVLGREVTCQRWTLRGPGLAAPSVFDFDQHGMLVHALLEKTQEYVLERAPKGVLDSPK